MIALGITGRSGCGKSTVTAVFAAHGVPLADADRISREILLPGSPLLPKLAQRFGADILNADGTLNRRLLADRAFATPQGTARLTAITQPEIYHRLDLFDFTLGTGSKQLGHESHWDRSFLFFHPGQTRRVTQKSSESMSLYHSRPEKYRGFCKHSV